MITLPSSLYAFAAFPLQELSEYFKRKLKESPHLYVFSTRPDINRLFSEQEKSRCRKKNVMEIAEIRPDCG